jgi:diadenosine tetraphosphatase ApaH/serine/threonine PP2A family protein phosphatase
MWAAYADTSRWITWAPHIRRVDPLGSLEEGMRGVVRGPFGASARFEVTSVDAHEGRWTWKVRVGAARLTIDHEVADGRTSVDLDGPAPLVLAYAPVARRALERLVHVRAAR